MTEQRLGLRALVLYIIKGILPGMILLFMAFIILGLKDIIINSFINAGYAGPNTINTIVLFTIGGLYIASMLVLAIGLIFNLLHYFSTTFGMDDYGFKLHRGIISKNEISIPYHQIQDVDVDQSVFGRLLGIGKLIILTAGNENREKNGEESEVVFNIIDISLAKSLQKSLIEKSSVQLVKEAK